MNRNNVIKPGWGLLCLCMLLAPLFVRSQETPERECILIVSSYNPDTRRMARFITEFEQQILALGIPVRHLYRDARMQGNCRCRIVDVADRQHDHPLREPFAAGRRAAGAGGVGLVRVAGPHSRRGHVLLRVRQFERRDASAGRPIHCRRGSPVRSSIRA